MIVVYGIKERLDPIKADLSECIHRCMCDVLGLPSDKRAQRFVGLDKSDFYYPGGRSDRYTVIEINMMRGREKDTLKKLIHRLFQEIEKDLKIAPLDIEITIKEQEPHCWGFRGITGDDAQLNYRIDV